MKEIFKSCSLSPDVFAAADSDEIVIKLIIGKDYSSAASRIIFDLTATLGTSLPNHMMNEMSGYTEAYVNNPHVRWNLRVWDVYKGFVSRENPGGRESSRIVVLDLDGGLNAGDVVELHWGETTGGFGPGTKVTSVVPYPSGYYGKVDVRYFSDPEGGLPEYGPDFGDYKRPAADYEETLKYLVKPREVKRLRLLRGRDKALLVPYDRFWNTADVDNADALVSGAAGAKKNDHGVFEFADKNIQLKSKGLPMTESVDMLDAYNGMNIYFGDLHAHSYYSNDVKRISRVEMLPEHLMDFARYRSGLDFFAVADHHTPEKDFERIPEDEWNATIDAVNSRHKDGEFVVFPGLEYRDTRGDTCFIFNGPVSYDMLDVPASNSIKDIWKFLRSKNCDFMSIPHMHNPGSLPDEEFTRCPDRHFEPTLEIFSDHGSFEREDALESGHAWIKRTRPDRFATWMLKHNMRFGFAAHSDDHKGHAGVCGVTGVFTEKLDRDSIFDAYRNRRTYATTNPRIKLVFTANGQLMGSELDEVAQKEFFIDVTGENTLKKVELLRNSEVFELLVPDGGKSFKREIKVDSTGADYWYVRATQQDNHVAWSSPVWFD